MKCWGDVSDAFPVDAGVRQGCVLAPSLFSACMDWIMGRVVGGAGRGVSFGDVRITDLDFADDAVVFAETLEILTGALERLSEEAEPLGLRVSWLKTKVQASATSWMLLWRRSLCAVRMSTSSENLPTLAAWFTAPLAARQRSLVDLPWPVGR